MGDTREQASRQWAGRPRAAKLLRFAVWLVPIVVSVAATHFISKGFPRPPGLLPAIAWFAGLCVVATVILLVVDKVARRLLPLAALLQLSLVFPDSAPSRFKAALRTQTVRQLEQRVAEIKESGLSNDPAIAAETLIELIAALSAHDRLTRGHAERVRAYSRMIGEELKLSEKDLDLLQWAGLAHDVGKLFVPGEILNKTSRLTDEEFDVIKKHPGWGAELCEPLRPWLGEWVNAVGEHHERWDGKGYPNGLAGTDISFAARIVSVADVYDVITSIRSYKAAGTSAEAREELAKCAGTQFDERMVRAFLNISLGRLRLAMGPLSWMAQVPIVAQMPLVPVAGAAASMVVTGAAMLVGGTFAGAEVTDVPDVPVAEAAPLPDTTLPEPLPPPTVPLVIVTAPAPTPTTSPARSAPPPATAAVSAATVPATTLPALATTLPVATRTTSTTLPAAAATTTSTTTTTVPPLVALNRAMAADEDSTIEIDVGDGGGPAVVASVLVGPANATVEHRGGTLFAFRAADDFNGETSFEFEIRDALGRTSPGRVVVTVVPTPDAPRAANDVAAVTENGTVEIAVLANDMDPDGDAITVAAVSSADGTVSTDGTTILYSPATDTFGTHQVEYIVEDDTGRSDRGTVRIAVSPVNSRPTLVDPGAQSVDEGAPLSFVAGASDPDVSADGLTFTLVDGATPVPAGAAIDPDTGVFSWTPSESQGGTSYSFRLRVTDDGAPSLFDEVEVAFGVNDVNDAPVLAPIGDRAVGEQAPMTFTLSASDPDLPADDLTFSATGLPTGASLDPSTGAFSWTPSEAQGDTAVAVTFSVTDDGAGALSDVESVVLSVSDVNVAPVLADPGAQSVDEGALLSFVVGASDTDVPADGLSFTLVDGLTPVPTGATIDLVTGAFSWTPSESQGGTSYSFKLRVTDDGAPGLFDEVEVGFDVDEVNQAPVLDPIGDQSTDEGASLSLTLSATDVDLPGDGLVFSASALPAGATLNAATGAFSWTPSESQGGTDFAVTFTVTDDGIGASSDEETLTLSATEVNEAPVLADPGAQSVDEGAVLSFTASATDADAPTDGLTFALADGVTPVPPGAAIDPVTGAFSWTPSESQGGTSYSFKIRVADDGAPNLLDEIEVSFAVNEVNNAPVLDPIGDQAIDEGASLTMAVSATDTDLPADGLAFSATGLPAGATLDGATGALSWTPTEVQGGNDFTVTFTVTDNGTGALADSETVQLTATEVNDAPSLTDPGDQSAAVGEVVSLSLTASDSDVPVNSLGFAATGLPAGLSIDVNTGVISGAPTTVESATVTVTVTETNGLPSNLSDNVTFDWTITPVNIVISEIATSGPGGATDEFIELYNPTSSTISIGGWELRRSDGNMTFQLTTVMTGGASIGPNSYFLISHNSVRMALGADDWYSSGELVVGAGIALFTDLGVEVDAVGTSPVPWKDGAGSLYGEGTHLPPMSGSVTQSYERKSGVGNCVDTDDNAVDFFHNMGSRNPQNSGSAAATCGTPTPPTPPPTPDHLVISEFRLDGAGGGDDEFVEIFNPTALPIPLLGYELRGQDGGVEATISPADILRLGTTFIGSGEHLVFGSATYDNGPSAYDKVDIRTSGSIRNDEGMYLVAPAIPSVSPEQVVDAVSTGGTAELEGTPLPPITGRVIHSYERLLGASGGNCFDTDDNTADFFHNLGSENPQLLSAPATPC